MQLASAFRSPGLAAALTGAVALGAAPALRAAADLQVLSCTDNDSDVATLRKVVASAGFGDTIDMSALGCSSITLTQGEIPVNADALKFLGPTDHALTISAAGSTNSRVLHTACLGGSVTIENLTITGGAVYDPVNAVYGGCILAECAEAVVLNSSVVTGCSAGSGSSTARGGGVSSRDGVYLYHSQVVDNVAYAYGAGSPGGGGIFVDGTLKMHYSTLSANSASARGTGSSLGGGAFVLNEWFEIYYSTIDSNRADFGAGLALYAARGDAVLRNSTISGNAAGAKFGGLYMDCILRSIPQGDCLISLKVYNSTIAFNGAPVYPGAFTDSPVKVQSSIIAKNWNGSADLADLFVSGASSTSASSGANNLIISSNLGFPGTLTADPQLAPLAYHGGPTRTHALLATSPAVDHGNDTLSLSADQRGGAFARVVNSTADIGAYERQANDDEIFWSGFQ